MFNSSTSATDTVPSTEPIEIKSTQELDDSGEFAKKVLPTLPPQFKTLIGKSINIESDEPQEIIELLGELLGVTDYQVNMPSFWFLDTLARQVMQRKHLDGYHTSVLISWLAGEIKLIREKRYARDEFFARIQEMFTEAANKICENQRLLYWDEIIRADAEEEFENLFTENRSRDSLRNKVSQESIESNAIDPTSALNIVIDCTYDTYGNELRYALVYVVFVEPVEVQVYNLPFTLRTPRPVKIAQPKVTPGKLKKKLKKLGDTGKSRKSVGKAKGEEELQSAIGLPTTPPASLEDESSLQQSRMFILPLSESLEAAQICGTNSNHSVM